MPAQVARFKENSIECGTLLEMTFSQASEKMLTLEDSLLQESVWEEVLPASVMSISPNQAFSTKLSLLPSVPQELETWNGLTGSINKQNLLVISLRLTPLLSCLGAWLLFATTNKLVQQSSATRTPKHARKRIQLKLKICPPVKSSAL